MLSNRNKNKIIKNEELKTHGENKNAYLAPCMFTNKLENIERKCRRKTKIRITKKSSLMRK